MTKVLGKTAMMRAGRTIFVALLLSLGLGAAAVRAQTPEPRIALVVGNSAYKAGALATPANDAGLIAQALNEAGFDVVGARDLDQDSLRRAFREFLEKAAASGPDTIAFVYLAGYGLQYSGENYFVPAEATIPRDSSITIEALRLSDFTRPLADLPLKSRIVVLDAARANPFAPAGAGAPLAGGLSLVEPENGSLLAFNAAPGTVAPQETGDYGVYAKALAEMMREGGTPVADVFARARLRVNEATRGAQVPWDASRLTQSFAFFQPATDAAVQPPRDEALRTRPIRDFPVEEAYAAALERDTVASYQDFLAAYPTHPLAKRVQAMLAARREALTWRRAIAGNTPAAYWGYLQRYPKGPHRADARRRLANISAALEPPPVFDPYEFDIAPPPQVEYSIVDEPVVVFDEPDYAPPPPVFFLPPPRREFIDLPPPRVVSPGFLPMPLPIVVPGLRPWRGDRDHGAGREPIPMPRGVTPRDAGSPARFVAPLPRAPRVSQPAEIPGAQIQQQPALQGRQQVLPGPNALPPVQQGGQRPLLQPQPGLQRQQQLAPRQQDVQPRQQQIQPRGPSPQDVRRAQQQQLQQQQQVRQQQIRQQQVEQQRVLQQRDRGRQDQMRQQQQNQVRQQQQQQIRQQQMQQNQVRQQQQQQNQIRQQQMQQNQMRQQQQQQQQVRQQQMQQNQMRQQQQQQNQMRQQQQQQNQMRQQQQMQQQQQRQVPQQRRDCGNPGQQACR